jgi:hypothetical protein
MAPTLEFVISLILNVAFWGGVVYAILRVLDRVLPERLTALDSSETDQIAPPSRSTRGLQLARSPGTWWGEDPPSNRLR